MNKKKILRLVRCRGIRWIERQGEIEKYHFIISMLTNVAAKDILDSQKHSPHEGGGQEDHPHSLGGPPDMSPSMESWFSLAGGGSRP